MSRRKEWNSRSTRWQIRVLSVFLVAAPLAAQTGWQTVKDKTGVCQMSYPSNWTPLSPGVTNSPQGRTSMVLSGQRPYRPYSQETLQMYATKVLENSPTRVLWAAKPVGNSTFVTYHVESPGKTNSCIAEIPLPSNASEDEVKKIASSLTKTP